MDKKFKRSVKFKGKEIVLLERIFDNYLGSCDEWDEKIVMKMMDRLYLQKDKLLQANIARIEKAGYKVVKLE